MADEKVAAKTYGLLELVKGAAGRVSKEPEDTVFVWPHLVYREFLSLLLASVVLIFLSLFFGAPLEEPASHDTTPNPMKAPWYFLGLQELLVYFDPWLAGVVLPGFIIIGLMLIPFIDFNPQGKGYYTFSQRKFAVTMFSFGFALWFIVIIVGVWFRGLDWQWYWPWEDWSKHKPATAVKLVDLEVILQNFLGLPETPLFSIPFLGLSLSPANLITWILFAGYYVAGFTIPFLVMRKFYRSLGFVRYNLVMFFFLTMMGVPLKVFLRLVVNIKYVLITPWFKI